VNRSEAARVAAYASWASTKDRSARTAAGHTGLLKKFEREARERLGPDASEKQIADAADAGRKLYYARLAAAGRAARAAKRSPT
jgi:hypothetical protein